MINTLLRHSWATVGVWLAGATLTLAQLPTLAPTSLPLNNLSLFRNPPANWHIAADATADLTKPNTLVMAQGTGVLVNQPTGQYGPQFNLLTQLEHGDIDLELDYMLAKGANSGVYLQGRYEIQLFDSWGVRSPKVVDNGAIYERWDDSRPAGSQGYEGTPARQNASRAPGLWQHLKIAFQAPRFGPDGRKTTNARMLRVELNGVLIHENVEVTGPTRSAAYPDEKATGPIMIQGDHGAVAIKNIQYISYDKPRPELVNLRYTVYKGKFDAEPDWAKTPPEAQGTATQPNSDVTRLTNEFVLRYTGTLRVPTAGDYTFNLSVPGGGGILRVNNKAVIERADWQQTRAASLPAGDLPFELIYAKMVDWAKPSLGLTVAGPGVREFYLTNADIISPDTDPILVEAVTNTILRSFMDIPVDAMPASTASKPIRVVHAVSVGSPEQVHYTYDMDNGAVVQVWRGQFLDTTPMWHDRGDGSSRPTGMVQRFGKPALLLARLASPQTSWPTDSSRTGFRTKGYMLDDSDRPTFMYQQYGAAVTDAIRVLAGSQGVQREIMVQNAPADLYARLAEGAVIETLAPGQYAIDGKRYYLTVSGNSPTIRSINGRQELLVPMKEGKLTYSVLF